MKRILGLKNDIQRSGLPANNSGVLKLDYDQLEIPQDYLADSEHDRDVRRYIDNNHQTKRDPMFRYIERHSKEPVMPPKTQLASDHSTTVFAHQDNKTSTSTSTLYLQCDDKVYAVEDISSRYQKYFKINSDSANYNELNTSMEVYAYPWKHSDIKVINVVMI